MQKLLLNQYGDSNQRAATRIFIYFNTTVLFVTHSFSFWIVCQIQCCWMRNGLQVQMFNIKNKNDSSFTFSKAGIWLAGWEIHFSLQWALLHVWSCTCKTLVGVTPPCILPRQFVSLKQAQRQEQCGVGDRLVCIGGGRGFVVCAWKQGSSLFSTDSWPAFTFRGHIPVEPWMAVIVGRARQRPVQTGRHQHFRWSACWPVSTLSLLCAV